MNGVRTFDFNEAAAFLKVDRTTALSLAGPGQLPGAKIGRAWLFLKSDVVAYLEREIAAAAVTPSLDTRSSFS
ncbi:helix-turn-helix domain-containing protein [Trinickia symbiotica]|uniref:DNA-binding protein n=2 Tax=Trinickia symbiotica TaxID=863227 RepID=A0A2N7WUW4_9BURK|nr:DNA-binding protein [Trinickia symbiotica]